ncbi:MAG: 2,3-bisphosphoglycerate-independent phosphoglycerate mutase [Candidatus Magasanikbacteria bacterium]|jgi:2,3-bisphosphoglycerate-independent phosphoglycerate mutase|nr:2,3-bisphosphoglycerate-independent phosphoglycerate mutase [Candidatus Magasanikbacteria bacterium]
MDSTSHDQKREKNRKALLVIMDGFGLADPNQPGNAITPETAPHIFALMETYPTAKLDSHGVAVGLPEHQEGNSEAGHLNIGAGRLVKQDVSVVSDAIVDGTFFKNPAFAVAKERAQKGGRVHIMGLLTGIHSAHTLSEHLYSLLKYFRDAGIHDTHLHLFTDGRDSSQHSAISHLTELRKHMQNGEKIATIMGRFYGMDRNKSWKRTKLAYDVLVGDAEHACADTAEQAIQSAYNRDETDEYISPTCIEGGARIQDGDVVLFFNARSDRARQLTKAFLQPDFVEKNPHAFERKTVVKDLCFVAMSEFGPDLPHIHTAFPSPDIDWCLAKAIGEQYQQLYLSETEKYAHVTYFINGGYPEPINGEDRVLVKSTGVKSYAENPEMQTPKLAKDIIYSFDNGSYDFVCVNFPNADMVGHTGDFEAAKKAVQILDDTVHALAEYIEEHNGIMVITADHGNAEKMINEKTKEKMTAHTDNPVPMIVVDLAKKDATIQPTGTLADVAPTLLALMGCDIPPQMTGKNLFQ